MQKIQLSYFKSEVGNIQIGVTDRGVCSLEFVGDNKESSGVDNIHIELAKKELGLYFKGELQEFTVPLDVYGTEFQKLVWTGLQEIPYGESISYAQQANMLGRPTAVRAVANANARNKIAIIIPCHRVIGSNGKLTGYAYGVEKKQFLLDLEKKQI